MAPKLAKFTRHFPTSLGSMAVHVNTVEMTGGHSLVGDLFQTFMHGITLHDIGFYTLLAFKTRTHTQRKREKCTVCTSLVHSSTWCCIPSCCYRWTPILYSFRYCLFLIISICTYLVLLAVCLALAKISTYTTVALLVRKEIVLRPSISERVQGKPQTPGCTPWTNPVIPVLLFGYNYEPF